MGWLKEIKRQPQKIKWSQNGEEYILKYILDHIGEANRFFVDLGAWDGQHLSNTKIFSEAGWKGLLVDGKDFPGVYKSFITRDNILETLYKHQVPIDFDLLSIDIDGNDYWILKKVLSEYKPRLIISEYNSEHQPEESKTIEYDPEFQFFPCDYYGYTFGAGKKLAEEFGYTIIYQNSNTNLYYLRNDLVTEEPDFKIELFRHWNAPSDKKWIHI